MMRYSTGLVSTGVIHECDTMVGVGALVLIFVIADCKRASADDVGRSDSLLLALVSRCNVALESDDMKTARGVYTYAAKKHGDKHPIVVMMKNALTASGEDFPEGGNVVEAPAKEPSDPIVIRAYSLKRFAIYPKNSGQADPTLLLQYLQSATTPRDWNRGDARMAVDPKSEMLIVASTQRDLELIGEALARGVAKKREDKGPAKP